jgi:hypothetical protein
MWRQSNEKKWRAQAGGVSLPAVSLSISDEHGNIAVLVSDQATERMKATVVRTA